MIGSVGLLGSSLVRAKQPPQAAQPPRALTLPAALLPHDAQWKSRGSDIAHDYFSGPAHEDIERTNIVLRGVERVQPVVRHPTTDL